MAVRPNEFDAIVVGGGPGGSSAAWHLAKAGASVLCVDKARFPREKPCGDGITPRAANLICEMGLKESLKCFHRIDSIRLVCGGSAWERRIPTRPGLGSHGYVVSRSVLDAMLLEEAERCGAKMQQDTRVSGAIVEAGKVVGITAIHRGHTQKILAPIVVGADGTSSRLRQGCGLALRRGAPAALLIRAQVQSSLPSDNAMALYPEIRYGGKLLPGYGWVFPMGNGMMNIGLGYLTTVAGWKEVNVFECFRDFLGTLPTHWELPSIEELKATRALNGWKLLTGLAVWPPWCPGLMLVGDAAGVAKPFNGAGISRALASGKLAAEVAVRSLGAGTPADLGQYEVELKRMWGKYYRIGRSFQRLIGHPSVGNAVLKLWQVSPEVMLRMMGVYRVN